MLDGVAKLNRMLAEQVRRSRNRDAHRAVRNGVPHADLGARADGSLERAGVHVSSCTARIRASPAPTPPIACWRGGWPSAACASFSSIIAAGTSTTICRATSRCSASGTDQASAALVQDLKQRGLLDDTLVIWGGEFGRTVYCQGKLTRDNYGRDHHPRCFTMWMAGRRHQARACSIGETDDFCYNIVEDPVHVHDLQATDPALPGHRPHQADLQVPGPPLPADRRRGRTW